jgi:hypothetical protein
VKAGAYSLHWTPTWSVHQLRVALKAHGHFRRDQQRGADGQDLGLRRHSRHATNFSMTCHTTAKNGARARLYDGGHLVDTVEGGRGPVQGPRRTDGRAVMSWWSKHSRKRTRAAHLAL